MSQSEISKYHCQCETWTGERCAWVGPASDMVVMEYMPEYLRASHRAAGNAGTYPANGAVRVAVEVECADLLIRSEGGEDGDGGEWSRIVPDARIEDYADEGD